MFYFLLTLNVIYNYHVFGLENKNKKYNMWHWSFL